MDQRIFLVLAALPLISWSQFKGSASTTTPLTRHYRESESLTYHMKTINQGRAGTIRYEADAKGTAKKDGAGRFIEEFQWSGLSFNGQSVLLSNQLIAHLAMSGIRRCPRLLLDHNPNPQLP